MKNSFIRIKLGKINCYLISTNDGFLLIDTGYEKDYVNFIGELKKINIDVKKIKYLLLTHHHDDHCGFTNNLLNDTDLKIITHKLAIELLKKGRNDKKRGGGYINKRIYYLSKVYKFFNPDWTLTFPPVFLRNEDIFVENDDDYVLQNIGIDGKILFSPGHTVDSISILLSDGTLFCGDAAMSWPLWAGTKYCTIFITNLNEYYESWNKFIKSDVKKIYPSHGEPFDIGKLKKNIGKYKKTV